MVCSLFGYACAYVLEILFALWLLSTCIYVGTEHNRNAEDVLLSILYVVGPYVVLLFCRGYGLVKAQAYRRDLKRTADFLAANESTRLMRKPDLRGP